MFFFIRRIVFAFVVVFLRGHFEFQLVLVVGQCLVSLFILIVFKPYSSTLRHWMEITNEITFLLIVCHLPIMTDYTVDIERKTEAGIPIIIIIALHSAKGIVVIVVTTFLSLYRSGCRKKAIKDE